jgi:predicted metalloprotease with PDZ domain
MRWLYQNRNAGPNRYGLEDLVAGLTASTGIDYATFMSRHVDGTEPLALPRYLDFGEAAMGTYRHLVLSALEARGQRPSVELPPLEPALAAALGLEPRPKR